MRPATVSGRFQLASGHLEAKSNHLETKNDHLEAKSNHLETKIAVGEVGEYRRKQRKKGQKVGEDRRENLHDCRFCSGNGRKRL